MVNIFSSKDKYFFGVIFVILLAVTLIFGALFNVVTGLSWEDYVTSFPLILVVLFGLSIWLSERLRRRASVDDTFYQLMKFKSTGFEIRMGGNPIKIAWKDVTSVLLDKRKTKLALGLRDGSEIVLSNGTENWYRLLKEVPDRFAEFDHTYVEQLFEQVESCQICGTISVYKGHCLSCDIGVWKGKAENRDNYIKTKQLELFATDEKDELVNFYFFKDEECGFDFDDDWEILVTQDEVKAYSKEQYWEA